MIITNKRNNKAPTGIFSPAFLSFDVFALLVWDAKPGGSIPPCTPALEKRSEMTEERKHPNSTVADDGVDGVVAVELDDDEPADVVDTVVAAAEEDPNDDGGTAAHAGSSLVERSMEQGRVTHRGVEPSSGEVHCATWESIQALCPAKTRR
jgi:hypothetical protein